MIKIKCDYLNGAVVVPTDIVDKHLKLASAASFKVLLFILRNAQGTADAKQISMCTGLAECDVLDCLDYWEAHNVIEINNEAVDDEAKKTAVANAKAVINTEETQENVETTKVTKIKPLPVKKPTQRDIAKRLSEEPELGIIYNEVQNILGTFGYDTQALLLMIYDYYGFPPEVIITLVQHQKCEGKLSTLAIKNRAEDWAKRGIDTLELVQEELMALDKINKIYAQVKGLAGFSGDIPTTRFSKHLRSWAVDMECSAELIEYALTESGGVLADAGKLLKKWTNSGLKTPQEVEEKTKKSIPQAVQKSYNTEDVGKNSVLDWIKRYAKEDEEQ